MCEAIEAEVTEGAGAGCSYLHEDEDSSERAARKVFLIEPVLSGVPPRPRSTGGRRGALSLQWSPCRPGHLLWCGPGWTGTELESHQAMSFLFFLSNKFY